MATLTGAKAASTAAVPGLPVPAGVPGIAWGYYNFATAASTADVVDICKVPAGATVILGFFQGADIDTGTEALDIDIGWKANGTDVADPDGFGNFGVLSGDAVAELKPVAGLWNPLVNVLQDSGFKTFAAETTITVTVTAAANAGGTGMIKVVLFYV
jgi:hypothetical protein